MEELSHPVVAIFAFGILLGVGFAVAALFLAKRKVSRVAFGAVSVAFILTASWLMIEVHAPHWLHARHKTYRNFYDGIRNGMSREQVIRTMEEHYPAGGPRQRPQVVTDTPTELDFLMTPETSNDPNAEGISVRFADGRVVRKFYSRD